MLIDLSINLLFVLHAVSEVPLYCSFPEMHT